MNIFQLPTTLITSIEKMIKKFWQGHDGSSRRIPWMSWEKLTIHKNFGGTGFKDISIFNLAILGKQGLKFFLEKQYLMSRIFKARYFPTKIYLTTIILAMFGVVFWVPDILFVLDHVGVYVQVPLFPFLSNLGC